MAIISASGAAFHLNGIHPCPVRDLLATNNCDSNLPNFIHSLMVQCLSQSSSQKVYGLNRQIPEGKEQREVGGGEDAIPHRQGDGMEDIWLVI